jgi:hypothetical protein
MAEARQAESSRGDGSETEALRAKWYLVVAIGVTYTLV